VEGFVSQKIVGNFVVGTVYSRDDAGQWSGAWLVRRYGTNNGEVIALQSLSGNFGSCEEARTQAMAQGEAYAKGLDAETGSNGGGAAPGSGDELFIPPSAQAQRAQQPQA
jgi:hypothetical protein